MTDFEDLHERAAELKTATGNESILPAFHGQLLDDTITAVEDVAEQLDDLQASLDYTYSTDMGDNSEQLTLDYNVWVWGTGLTETRVANLPQTALDGTEIRILRQTYGDEGYYLFVDVYSGEGEAAPLDFSTIVHPGGWAFYKMDRPDPEAQGTWRLLENSSNMFFTVASLAAAVSNLEGSLASLTASMQGFNDLGTLGEDPTSVDFDAAGTQACVLSALSTPSLVDIASSSPVGHHTLIVKQDGVGSKTVSLSATDRTLITETAFALSVAADAVDVLDVTITPSLVIIGVRCSYIDT